MRGRGRGRQLSILGSPGGPKILPAPWASFYSPTGGPKLDCGNICDWTKHDPWTIAFWFKQNSDNNYFAVIGKRFNPYDATTGWSIEILYKRMRVLLCNWSPWIRGLYVEATQDHTINQWHHCVITYDGTARPAGFTMTIDGSPQTLNTLANNLDPWDIETAEHTVIAGLNYPAGYYPFKGWLDEIGVWNRALSAEEIAEIYSLDGPVDLRTTSAAASLIHWYRLGDGDTYPTCNDLVGSADAQFFGPSSAENLVSRDPWT